LTDYRPFLKWAGGKRQLLPLLVAHVKRLEAFKAFHEPFVGGGALYFALRSQNLIGNGAFLSDVNFRLIEAYQGVATSVDDVIGLLKTHASKHSNEYFYAVRASVPATSVERAARLIYLNHTCFNGLYRENSKGLFNVPIGRYTNPTICDEHNLRAVSVALGSAAIAVRPFEAVLDAAKAGDLVYFDPPYVPVSRTASFTAYAQNGFSMNDQARLAELFAELSSRGVFVMLSNSKTDEVMDLYARFHINVVHASRAMNSKPDRRGKVEEVIVTNF
jgi:DNA adenine methylase